MSNNNHVSFDEFVSSKVWCDDLSAHFGECFDFFSNEGFIYAGCYWIEQLDDGKFWVLVGRDEKISDDLSVLEEWLWDEIACRELNYEEGVA